MKYLMTVFGVLLVLTGPVKAAGEKLCAIRVENGNVIVGTLLGFEHGVYTIRTLMSRIEHIPESMVLSIDIQGGPGKQPGPAAAENRLKGSQDELMQKVLNDPRLFLAMKRLSEDPKAIDLLKDPALMELLKAGDIEAVKADPKFIELANNQDFLMAVQRLLAVPEAPAPSPSAPGTEK